MTPRPTAPLALVLLGLVAGGTARAADDPPNLFGARIGPRYGYISVGFPDVEGGARFPLGGVELGVRLRTTLGVVPYSPIPDAVAFQPGLDLRATMFDRGDVTGAFVASLDVGVAVPNNVSVGVSLLRPGFLFTWRAADVIDIDFGFIVQDDLWVTGGAASLTFAFPVVFGVEYGVTDDITVGVRFEGGPAFTVGVSNGQGFGGVGPRLRGVFGAGFAF
ncbi:MAG: hypothetical protein H6733_06440 [Alphaproteobacteria bacterium]|nr:hypothetical protein [Alphaproteobacteria bacterium]